MNILQLLKRNIKRRKHNNLNTDLSKFGLEPNDWYLVKEDGLSYRIENKSEPSFFFRGKVHFKNGKKQWKDIRLAGL